MLGVRFIKFFCGAAFNIGKGALAGGSLLGLGALCYYGIGISGEAGALQKSA